MFNKHAAAAVAVAEHLGPHEAPLAHEPGVPRGEPASVVVIMLPGLTSLQAILASSLVPEGRGAERVHNGPPPPLLQRP